MNKAIQPPKHIWITSFILLIVTFMVYYLFSPYASIIAGLIFGYCASSLPLTWFLYMRFASPYLKNISQQLNEQSIMFVFGRFLVNIVLHHVNIFIFIFLFPIAPLICYVLWIIAKQAYI